MDIPGDGDGDARCATKGISLLAVNVTDLLTVAVMAVSQTGTKERKRLFNVSHRRHSTWPAQPLLCCGLAAAAMAMAWHGSSDAFIFKPSLPPPLLASLSLSLLYVTSPSHARSGTDDSIFPIQLLGRREEKGTLLCTIRRFYTLTTRALNRSLYELQNTINYLATLDCPHVPSAAQGLSPSPFVAKSAMQVSWAIKIIVRLSGH